MSTRPGKKRTTAMWMRAIDRAGILSRRQVSLLNAMLRIIDWNTGRANASVRTYAAKARISPRTVRRAMTELELLGVLSFPNGRRGGDGPDGRPLTNLVVVSLDRLEELGRQGEADTVSGGGRTR